MKLAVLGASGHGKVVAGIALRRGWKTIDFFDDAWPMKTTHRHWSVVGNTETLRSRMDEYDGWFVAIGDNRIRLKKINEFQDNFATLITLVDPDAHVSEFASIGAGTVVVTKAVVHVDCELGIGCIINTSATVDHDCKLSDGVHISPGANLAGGVHIGTCSWVGIGAAVKQLIRIGDDAVIGAGAAVVKDVAPRNTVTGTPARPVAV